MEKTRLILAFFLVALASFAWAVLDPKEVEDGECVKVDPTPLLNLTWFLTQVTPWKMVLGSEYSARLAANVLLGNPAESADQLKLMKPQLTLGAIPNTTIIMGTVSGYGKNARAICAFGDAAPPGGNPKIFMKCDPIAPGPSPSAASSDPGTKPELIGQMVLVPSFTDNANFILMERCSNHQRSWVALARNAPLAPFLKDFIFKFIGGTGRYPKAPPFEFQ